MIRATHAFDLLVELGQEQILPLVRALGAGFYADVPSMREALQPKSSFHVLHRRRTPAAASASAVASATALPDLATC